MKIIQIIPESTGMKAQIQGQPASPIEFLALMEDAIGNRRVEGMIHNDQTQQFVPVSQVQGFEKYVR